MKERVLDALKGYPMFSIRDIAHVLNKDMNYAYLVAYRLKKKGAIHEIEKGKYTTETDSFLIASWVVWPSYISGWAALNFHKLTEQLPFTIHVATTRKRRKKTIIYGGTKIQFIHIKKGAFFGFERMNYQDREIFIAEKEKAITDALASKKMSMAEAIEIIKKNRRKINIRKLLIYAKTWQGLAKKIRVALYD